MSPRGTAGGHVAELSKENGREPSAASALVSKSRYATDDPRPSNGFGFIVTHAAFCRPTAPQHVPLFK